MKLAWHFWTGYYFVASEQYSDWLQPPPPKSRNFWYLHVWITHSQAHTHYTCPSLAVTSCRHHCWWLSFGVVVWTQCLCMQLLQRQRECTVIGATVKKVNGLGLCVAAQWSDEFSWTRRCFSKNLLYVSCHCTCMHSSKVCLIACLFYQRTSTTLKYPAEGYLRRRMVFPLLKFKKV